LDFAKERLAQTERLLTAAKDATLDARRTKLVGKLQAFFELTTRAEATARRFVVHGEQIPASEKLYSIFEPETELIHRGKTPIAYEFGHRVAVIEDQLGFIVHGEVFAAGEQDRDATLRLTKTMAACFGPQIELSFDRGFHLPGVEAQAEAVIDLPCIPTTGTHAAQVQDHAASEAWHRARKRHPGIESAIGALQRANGLKRCRDRGELGYARYLQLAILARNLFVLGRIKAAQIDPECAAGRTRRQAA
jgi:hypothetical protein